MALWIVRHRFFASWPRLASFGADAASLRRADQRSRPRRSAQGRVRLRTHRAAVGTDARDGRKTRCWTSARKCAAGSATNAGGHVAEFRDGKLRLTSFVAARRGSSPIGLPTLQPLLDIDVRDDFVVAARAYRPIEGPHRPEVVRRLPAVRVTDRRIGRIDQRAEVEYVTNRIAQWYR